MDWNKTKNYSRKDLLDEIQALESKAEFYEQSLHNMLNLMAKVASGKQTTDEMGRVVSLNYPEFREKLPKRLRKLPPKRPK